uniref:DUF4920 domain-containing protein n=1 Tax=Ammonifex degensii TaxID=42838 RepID=A0A7C1JK98_9THEO
MSRKALLLLSGITVALLVLAVLFMARESGGRSKYGIPIDNTTAETVELSSLLANAQAYIGKQVIVSGLAGQVCQTSGCWITVTDGANQLFVQFYDFTVKLKPGTRVRVLGKVRIQNNVPYLVGQGLEMVK